MEDDDESSTNVELLCSLLRKLVDTEKLNHSSNHVDELRNSNYLLHTETIETDDEKLSARVLEDGLRNYQDLMIDPEGINNYCDDVIELLNTQAADFCDDDYEITETGLDDPLSYLANEDRDCHGRPAENIPQSTGIPSFTPKMPISKPSTSKHPSTSADTAKPANSHEGVSGAFRTAKDELIIQNMKKYGTSNPAGKAPLFAYGRKTLGGRRTIGSKFVCPSRTDDSERADKHGQHGQDSSSTDDSQEDEIDERLKHIDPKMVELIRSEIMDRFQPLSWDDIAGLEYAKTIIKEAVVWPILRPDIFTGLRKPPRGILLFGPPGTGKTLIGKCIASQSKSTFFSISASSLTSKWIGDGEKMVRALFAVAVVHQPAVVFIDEIDSLLCQRSDTEHESSRRLKTEFLVQLDGAATAEDERILIVGATNRPQELDEAARRRLVKRLYIPLPERAARIQILTRLLERERNSLEAEEIARIGDLTEGFSGADMKVLCHEASMGPIRSIPFEQLGDIAKDQVRPICYEDFQLALTKVKASVSPNDLQQYVAWDRTYGAGAI
uniref:AAA+ ATPase domain-containing protein n=1 Tax=Anopheles maculatus TaxID=74869 RepID=A0A182TB16_9DIPT